VREKEIAWINMEKLKSTWDHVSQEGVFDMFILAWLGSM
jgi:hypothetical protein